MQSCCTIQQEQAETTQTLANPEVPHSSHERNSRSQPKQATSDHRKSSEEALEFSGAAGDQETTLSQSNSLLNLGSIPELEAKSAQQSSLNLTSFKKTRAYDLIEREFQLSLAYLDQNQRAQFEVEEAQFAETRRPLIKMTSRLIWSYFIAELIGTFLLVVIGDGAIAAYVLTKKEIDLFSACFAFGVGAMVATFTAAKISGAHINPAATVAFALDGRLSWKLVPIYICAQYLGGILGAMVLFVNYAEAIQALDGGSRVAFGSASATGMIFATYPGAWVSLWGSLLDQIVGTAILLFSLSAISDKDNANLEPRHQPIYVALVIGLVCVAFSPNCGAIFNPARDLAPRLVTALFGYKTAFQPTRGLYWLTAGVLGPHIGAIVGLFAYKYLIGKSLAYQRRQTALNELEQSKRHPNMQLHSSKFGVHAQQQQQESGDVINYGPSLRG